MTNLWHVRHALATALSYQHISYDATIEDSLPKQAQFGTSNLYAEEHLGTYFSDHVPESPNCLFEEMIKCISAIYCELADPPIVNNGYTCSPITFSALMHDFSLFQIPLLLSAFNLHMLMLSYKCMKFKSLAVRLVVMYAIFAFQLLYFLESIITRPNIIVYAIGSSPIDANSLEKNPSILPCPDPRHLPTNISVQPHPIELKHKYLFLSSHDSPV